MAETLKAQQDDAGVPEPDYSAHIIVFGNEKGGSGKSTGAMHAAIALLRMGYKVGTIDLDARQATLTHYMRNRFRFITKTKESLPSPAHMAIERSTAESVQEQRREERDFLMMALAELGAACDFLVIDTPGSDSHLSRLAHSYADTLVTPINDSFIDLDMLADIDPARHTVNGPSVYSRMVAEQMQARRERPRRSRETHWIVMRNRLSHINAKNKESMENILRHVSGQLGFQLASGFGERVIFRELFLKGLTLLDLQDDPENRLTLSQISARQEVRDLIRAIGPERYKPLG